VAPVDVTGLSMEYTYSKGAEYIGTWTATVMAPTTWMGMEVYEVDAAGSIKSSTFAETYTQVTYYTCDGEGVHMLGGRTEYSGTSSGYAFSGWADSDYRDDPGLQAPPHLHIGDTWDGSYSGTMTNQDGHVTPVTVSQNKEVLAQESVTVPAGPSPPGRSRPSAAPTPGSTGWPTATAT